MNFALSTSAWMEALAKTEVKKQWWKIWETIDRLVQFSWDEDLIAKVNLWSRVWNKLYISLWEKENVKTFDELFDFVSEIDWKKYFKNKHPILIRSSSARSELFADRTIQSICKKAVVKSLVWEWQFFDENEKLEKMDILVLLINNKARILLNTSWNALHMRWYRKEAWDAPIKESHASFLYHLMWSALEKKHEMHQLKNLLQHFWFLHQIGYLKIIFTIHFVEAEQLQLRQQCKRKISRPDYTEILLLNG